MRHGRSPDSDRGLSSFLDGPERPKKRASSAGRVPNQFITTTKDSAGAHIK